MNMFEITSKKVFMLFSFFALLSCKTQQDLPVVQSVDLSQYAGVWYEIARLPNKFEKGLNYVSATYSIKENQEIEVFNKGINEKNETKTIKGKAWLPNKSESAKLKVQFFAPFSANYWIIALDDNYQYALIGEPGRKYLWVLSRTKNMDEQVYQKLINIAQKNGFDTSTIIKIKQ